ncbi:hypothetical protein JW964_09535 [candidate division KSB1 bacterium]|nr:hypothetical protein [candidate division KSB1 bacterium]
MPRNIANFLATARTLFENASLPEVANELLLYGYDSTKLTNERAIIATFEKVVETKERTSAAAQLATQDQKTALKKLNDWRQQYIKIARVALHERAELLEKLGVRIYSSKTPAQRNAPKKAAANRLKKKEQNQAKNAVENPSEKKAE